ncbi:unnamed protein product [Miscanthus lutarioriparius]|uniref:Uncharacterized protein n=1 Tax=Miscanthus lutarioriparius TaxID=422564 RepID=A0A811SQ23_9POAL|nr:unnamed protein product [Miscanthus lutarioriparius]
MARRQNHRSELPDADLRLAAAEKEPSFGAPMRASGTGTESQSASRRGKETPREATESARATLLAELLARALFPTAAHTIFEDATPELVRDFFCDGDFRLNWDPMLAHSKTLDEIPQNGATVRSTG